MQTESELTLHCWEIFLPERVGKGNGAACYKCDYGYGK